MTYREEVAAALRHVETAVDHYYETMLEAPEPKRRRIFDSFKVVTGAVESCGRYAQRMLLLEWRIESARRIFDGATSVAEAEAPSIDSLDVGKVLNDYRPRRKAPGFIHGECQALKLDENRYLVERNVELCEALELAAKALDIAESWNLYDVQIDPPKEWKLDAADEDPEEGWCSVRALARKLLELADPLKGSLEEE